MEEKERQAFSLYSTADIDEQLTIVAFILAGLYFALLLAPLVQLLRIQCRIPGLGWTTQKLFFVLTFISALGMQAKMI